MDLTHLYDQIGFYMTAVIMPATIVLDLFAIYIFSRPTVKKSTNLSFLYTCSFSIHALSVFAYIFLYRSTIVLKFDVFTYSNMSCKLSEFICRYLMVLPPWILVFIAFDRFRLIHCPSKLMFMKR